MRRTLTTRTPGNFPQRFSTWQSRSWPTRNSAGGRMRLRSERPSASRSRNGANADERNSDCLTTVEEIPGSVKALPADLDSPGHSAYPLNLHQSQRQEEVMNVQCITPILNVSSMA